MKNAEIFDYLDTNVGFHHQEEFDTYFEECANICATMFGKTPRNLRAYCQKNWDRRDEE